MTFNAGNWLEWQEVTVTANTDYMVEDLVVTSTIRHSINTVDVQYANGRVNVPDVVVDVINTDFANKQIWKNIVELESTDIRRIHISLSNRTIPKNTLVSY